MCNKFFADQMLKIAEGIILSKNKREWDKINIQDEDTEQVQIQKMFDFLKQIVKMKSEYSVVKKGSTVKKSIKNQDFEIGVDRWFSKEIWEEQTEQDTWDNKCSFVSPMKVGKNELEYGGMICGLESHEETEHGWRCKNCINQKSGKGKKGAFEKLFVKTVSEETKQFFYDIKTYSVECRKSDVGLCGFAPGKGKNKNKVCGSVTNIKVSSIKEHMNSRCEKCINSKTKEPKKGVVKKLIESLMEPEDSESEIEESEDERIEESKQKICSSEFVSSESESESGSGTVSSSESELESDDDDKTYTEEEIRKMKLKDLKLVCKEIKISAQGKKDELIDRIIENL